MMKMLQSGALTRAVKKPAREIEHTTQGTNAKPRQKGWREDNHTYTKYNAGKHKCENNVFPASMGMKPSKIDTKSHTGSAA